MGISESSPPPHWGGGRGAVGVTGGLLAFSCASLARRSFSLSEKMATERARFIRLCFTLVFFAANSSAAAIEPLENAYHFLESRCYLWRPRLLLDWRRSWRCRSRRRRRGRAWAEELLLDWEEADFEVAEARPDFRAADPSPSWRRRPAAGRSWRRASPPASRLLRPWS